MPNARIAFTVCMQSSLGRNPRSVQTPFDKAATITARWEMLLSPGTVISMSIRGARFTRNSIENARETDTGMLTARQKNRAALIRHPVCRIQHQRNRPNSIAVTAPERSCLCKDPSLQSREGILPHRYICQENRDSPRDAVCQGQGFRTDNLPSRPLSGQPSEEVLLMEVRSPLVAYPSVELDRLD